MKQNEDKQFNFHQDTNLKIIFNDGSESKNFKVSVDYHGNSVGNNSVYYYKNGYQPIHMMVCDIVMAENHEIKDIKEVEVNGKKIDFFHNLTPTMMEDPAPHAREEHIDLLEQLLLCFIDQNEFIEARLGEVDFNGCIGCIPVEEIA